MMKEMKAARLHAIGSFVTDCVPVPEPKGQELLMKVHACGICGSDIPRVYQHGTSSKKYPLTLGHEFAGEIVAVGPEADKGLIGASGAVFPLIPCGTCDACVRGDYAMCQDYDYLGSRRDGGFAQYCVIPSRWHLVEVPQGAVSYEALAMTEPATVAQHALRRGNVQPADFVVIFGAGPIGILAARWCRVFGAKDVVLVDVVEEKIKYAAEKNDAFLCLASSDLEALVRQRNGGRLADVVIEGTGSAEALMQAIACVRAGGRIALLGNPQRDTVLRLQSHSSVLRKELTIAGVWNSAYCDARRNEWRFTVEKMMRGELHPEDLITHRTDLDGLPGLVEQIHNREINICKAMCVME